MNLHSLLDSGNRFAPEYRGGLSNHLPMAVTALDRLGATTERQAQFFDHYSLKLEPASRFKQTSQSIRENEWELRGKADAFYQLEAHFKAVVQRDGIDRALRSTLPHLMPGCGAAAWHGLLRTAYALISRHEGELASGLAYWTSRYLDLGSVCFTGTTSDVHGPLQSLKLNMHDWHSDHGLIYLRMQDVAANKNFSREVGKFIVEEDALAALADHALDLYLRTRDFVVLHLVTSCHAMRLILPFCDDPIRAMHDYWKSFAAGVIASGANLEQEHLPLPSFGTWHGVKELACDSNDDHLIKMVFTLSHEDDHYQDARYLHAALMATSN